MQTHKLDQYHGIALAQIVRHPAFTALNRASDEYGHYRVNEDVVLFVKYRTGSRSPWSFTLHEGELERLRADLGSDARVFLCLVCGLKTVCLLPAEEADGAVIDLSCHDGQSIHVTLSPGKSMRVSGSAGALGRTVPHSAFPDDLFDE